AVPLLDGAGVLPARLRGGGPELAGRALLRGEAEHVVAGRREAEGQHRQADERHYQDGAPARAAHLLAGDPQRRQPPAHRACSSRSSGCASGPEVSTIRPSRRNTTRSAQAAWRASWVTSTPAAPASTRARSSRSTASP